MFRISKNAKFAVATAAVLACAAGARAATLSPDAGGFAVLSGGQLSTGTGVNIGGDAGAASSVYFNANTTVTGSVYAGSTFGTGSNVTVGNILANSGVSLGNNTDTGAITGASLNSSNNDTISGDVNVSGNVSLSKTDVSGAVNYNGSFWAKQGSIAGGKHSGAASVDSFSASSLAAPSFTHGSGSIWHPSNQTVSLDAGNYGSLSLSSGDTLNLTAGVYNFSSIYLAAGVTVNADTSLGDVIIRTSGGLSTDNHADILATGMNQLAIQSGGYTFIGNHSNIQGSISVYGGGLSVDQFTTIVGAAYSSGDMWLGNGVNVQGQMAMHTQTSHVTSVPEPASAAILVAAAALLPHRRRRAA